MFCDDGAVGGDHVVQAFRGESQEFFGITVIEIVKEDAAQTTGLSCVMMGSTVEKRGRSVWCEG